MVGLTDWVELHTKYLYTDYAGYSTTELAKILGVNRRTIQRWVKGSGSPSEEQLKKIQEYISSRR